MHPVPCKSRSYAQSPALRFSVGCPSGALTYSVEPDGEVEPDLATQVAVVADGPLWVTGGVPIERSDGQAVERRNRVTLCRCGQSANKPHCDGSHKESGFSDS